MKFKLLIIIILLLSTQSIFADQLAWITKEQASSAIEIIDQQKEILLFCGCCDNTPKIYLKPKKSRIQYTGTDNYFEVILNATDANGQEQEQALDLAYVFINIDGKANCLGKEMSLTCDPCTDIFVWESPFEATPNDFPLTVNTLNFKTADAIAQQAWLLTFNAPNNLDDEHLFIITWENLEKLGVSFVDWSNESHGVPNEKLIGKTFQITSYTTEVENEFTGESEIQSILTKAEMIQENQDGQNEHDSPQNKVDMKDVKRYVENVKSSYLISGLDDVNRSFYKSQIVPGTIDINKLIPEQENLIALGKMQIGIDDCAEIVQYCTLYTDNLVIENGITDHYFFLEDLKSPHYRLTKGMTKEQVAAVLGKPYSQRSNVMVYLAHDKVEEMHSAQPTKKFFYGAVRVIFEKGKLHSVWIINKGSC